MKSRYFVRRMEDALIGCAYGTVLGAIYASWIVVMILLNGSFTVQMPHGAELNGLRAIAAFLLTGAVAGTIISQLKRPMQNRAFAAAVGAIFGTMLVAQLDDAISWSDGSEFGSLVGGGLVAIGIGGYAGLKVREGLMKK